MTVLDAGKQARVFEALEIDSIPEGETWETCEQAYHWLLAMIDGNAWHAANLNCVDDGFFERQGVLQCERERLIDRLRIFDLARHFRRMAEFYERLAAQERATLDK